MSSTFFPLFNAFSNADFRALRRTIPRGSEWPVKITSAVRGGREAYKARRRVLRAVTVRVTTSGVTLGLVGVGVSATSDALGVVPNRMMRQILSKTLRE